MSTQHNKYGLTGGGDQPGCTEDRSQVLPFSLMLYSAEEGWQQLAVYATRSQADTAGGEAGMMYMSPWGICDTIWFLDCEDEIIRDLPSLKETT